MLSPITAASQPPQPGFDQALAYDGQLGQLYGIFFKNLLLTIVTLGIYRFWAITNYRRYFWSRTIFQGQRLEYTGTGGEIFKAVLLAGLALFGMAVATAVASYLLGLVWQPLMALPVILLYLAVLVLAMGAIFSAQRYRLSRTVWCGLRGGMSGSMLSYGLGALGCYLLAAVTLFQMLPWASIRLLERRTNASSFGSARFAFRGRAGEVYGRFVLTLAATVALFLVLTAAVAGLAWTQLSELMDSGAGTVQLEILSVLGWIVPAYLVFLVGAVLIQCSYVAFFQRYVVGRTTLAGVPFASTMSGTGLLRLVAGNIVLLVVTLGFGFPIILHRNARFLTGTLRIAGRIDPAGLTQSTLAVPAYGEGLFQQLDAAGGI